MTGGHAVDIGAQALQGKVARGSVMRGGETGLKIARIAAVLAGSVLLASCAALPFGGPAPLDTFELTAPAMAASGPQRSRVQLLVAEPSALKALDGENVVVKPSANAIEYLSGAQWGDRLPRVVQARLAQALEETGRLGGVGRPGEGLAIDFQLVTDIRSFEVRVDGAPRAEIELYLRILNDRNGVVRASRSFTATVPVQGSGNSAYVAALDSAFASVVEQAVGWTLASL